MFDLYVRRLSNRVPHPSRGFARSGDPIRRLLLGNIGAMCVNPEDPRGSVVVSSDREISGHKLFH